MSRPENRPRVRVHPGSGLVLRRGDALLVVPERPPGFPEPVRALVDLCARPDPGGTALHALLDRWPAPLPAFALLRLHGDALRVALHGPLQVLVDGRPGPAPDERLAEEVVEGGTWHEVTITPGGYAAAEEADEVLPLDLEAGVVPGSGVTVHAGAAIPEQASRSETALRPTLRFRSVPLGPCAAAARRGQPTAAPRRPLPIAGADELPLAEGTSPAEVVEGVCCPQGHFTDPDQPECLSCGAPLVPGSPRVRRPRPPLGILVTDGGTIYPVTGDLVIGRQPQHAPDVVAGRARAVPLHDAARSTSRVHARLTVRGWRVLLHDAGSANGTLVSGHGAAGPWLPAQSPLALSHGDRIRLGQRQLLFDTWRDSVVSQPSR